MFFVANIPAADVKAVGLTATRFDITMAVNSFYVLTSTVACWVAQGVAPTAAPNVDGNAYIPPNVPVIISGNFGAKLSIIQASLAGNASLIPGAI